MTTNTQHKVESVWEYPRPPSIEAVPYRVKVVFNGEVLADSMNSYRILETSHPPTYYIPPKDINMKYLKRTDRNSYCEFKGEAGYYTVSVNDKESKTAAWFYINPTDKYKPIKDHVSFYASKMEECSVDEEKVKPQQSDFYGGWITSWIDGGKKGFKGPSGTEGW